jgi:hypothetical protein
MIFNIVFKALKTIGVEEEFESSSHFDSRWFLWDEFGRNKWRIEPNGYG